MSTINLAVERGSGGNYPRFFTGGLIGSLIALALVGCLYGGLMYVNRDLNVKIADVRAQYTAEYQKFLAGNANEVADFANRSAVAEKFIGQDKSAEYIFSQLEASLLPAVYLKSMEYDRESHALTLKCITSGFNNEAKQILSFKENDAVSSIVLGKSTVNATTGEIEFSVTLGIK